MLIQRDNRYLYLHVMCKFAHCGWISFEEQLKSEFFNCRPKEFVGISERNKLYLAKFGPPIKFWTITSWQVITNRDWLYEKMIEVKAAMQLRVSRHLNYIGYS